MTFTLLLPSYGQDVGFRHFVNGMEVEGEAKFNHRVGVGINPTWALDIFSTSKTFHMLTAYPDGATMKIIELDTTVGGVETQALHILYNDTTGGDSITAFLTIGGLLGPSEHLIVAALGVQLLNFKANALSISQDDIELKYQSAGVQEGSILWGEDLFNASITGSIYFHNTDSTNGKINYVVPSDIGGGDGSLNLGSGEFLSGGDGINMGFTPTIFGISNSQGGNTTTFDSADPNDGYIFTGTNINSANSIVQLRNSAGSLHRFANDGVVHFGNQLNMTGNVVPTDTIYTLGTSGLFWETLNVKNINASDFATSIGSPTTPFDLIYGNIITAFVRLQGDTIPGGSLLLTSNTSNDGSIVFGITAGLQLNFDESNGRVGIGTTGTPATKLHVNTNGIDNVPIVTYGNTGGDIQISVGIQDPNGNIDGNKGDEHTDYVNAIKYIKTTDASNTGWVTFGGSATIVDLGYANSGNAGTFYVGGGYNYSGTSVTLTIGGSVTQTFGAAGESHAAHFFAVASGAGCTDCVLTLTGISTNDQGVKNLTASEVIVLDADEAITNQYFESDLKWLGEVTYTLTGAAGAFTFNYGHVKYNDLFNRDFTILGFEATGLSKQNETDLDIQLLVHNDTKFVYSAGAFIPNQTPAISLFGDHGTDGNDVPTGEIFAWKRDNLNIEINGNNGQGFIIALKTAVNNSIVFANFTGLIIFR